MVLTTNIAQRLTQVYFSNFRTNSQIYYNIDKFNFMYQQQHQRSQRQYQKRAHFQQKQGVLRQINRICQKHAMFTQQASNQIEQTDKKFYAIPEPASQLQKVIIKKSDLLTFTKHFANQKIKYDQELQTLQKKLKQLQITNEKNSKQNVLLNRQINQYKQELTKQQQKVKICQKRIKQLQNFEVLQLKRAVSQLQSRLAYEEQQLSRYQQFLKIKEEIIKNLQWQKSISNQKSKTQRSFHNKTQNAEDYYTQRVTNQFQNQRKNGVAEKHSETLRLQDLSQIAENTDEQYFNGKKSSTSKSIKNIRIGAYNQKYWSKAPQQQKSKKVITIKKRMNTESELFNNNRVNKQQQNEMKAYENQIQNLQSMIISLKQQAQIIQDENQKLIQDREIVKSQMTFSQTNNTPKIQSLQKSLNQKNLIIQKLQYQLSSKGFDTSLKKVYKPQLNKGSQNHNTARRALQASNKFSADKDRSILILNQKCLLLQKQVEKFMKKIIFLQKKNKQLQVSAKKHSKKQASSEQLITPQFKDIKFKKFFPKNNNEKESQISSQKDKHYKSHITNTFSKHELSYQLSNIKKGSPGSNENSEQKKSIIRNFNIDQIEDDEEQMTLQSDLRLFK